MDLVSSFFENILSVEPTEGLSSKRSSVISLASTGLATSIERPTQPSRRNSRNLTSTARLGAPPAPNQAQKATNLPPHQTGPASNPAIRSISRIWNYDYSDESKKSSNIISDKLVERIIAMIIPESVDELKVMSDRLWMQNERPPLSVNLMSRNSTQLHQRLLSLYAFMDCLVMFLSWYSPSYTLGVLMVLTHVILNPYLLGVLPVFLVVCRVLIPHYLVLYPPDRSLMVNNDFLETNPVPYDGLAPLHKFKVPKPVPQFSREFILNLTDTQNHMIFYIRTYDFLLWLTNNYLFFKDEDISTAVFVVLTLCMAGYMVVVPIIAPFLWRFFPFKIVLVSSLWFSVGIFHPCVADHVLEMFLNEESRVSFLDRSNKVENFLLSFLVSASADASQEDETVREVEIFELQLMNPRTKMWELYGYSADFYALNNSIRKLNLNLFAEYEENERENTNPDAEDSNEGDKSPDTTANDDDTETETENNDQRPPQGPPINYHRIDKTLTLTGVKPPLDWQFCDPVWLLDLAAANWVTSNFIEDLVSIDADEKWVYDFTASTSKASGVFRRRRWTRRCIRAKLIKAGDEKEPSGGFLTFLM